MGKRVLIVDDHPLFRDALSIALGQSQASIDATLHAEGIKTAKQHMESHDLDLILLDLNVSDMAGFDGFVQLNSSANKTPIVIVSATENEQAYREAQKLGAQGYIPKSTSLEGITSAIDNVLAGGTHFPEGEWSNEDNEAAVRLNQLTPTQRRVMRGLADGLLNKQIAYKMGISEATVKAHMTSIFRKLGANNRTQALLIYREAQSIFSN